MVCKAIPSYVKRPSNHYASLNCCIIFIGHFFFCVHCSYESVTDYLLVWRVCIPLITPQPQLPLYKYYFFCVLHKKTRTKQV